MDLSPDDIDSLYQQFQEESQHETFSSYTEARLKEESENSVTDDDLSDPSTTSQIQEDDSTQVQTPPDQSEDESSTSLDFFPPTVTLHDDDLYNCEICQGENTIQNINGVYICTACGTEKGIEISEALECQYAGQSIDDNSATARSGPVMNNLLYESNFKTKISGNRTSHNLKRMNNIWDSLTGEERSLAKDFKHINQICHDGRLPKNVNNYAQVLFKQVTDKQKKLPKGRNSRGDNRKGLILSSIFFSCKKYEINRSHAELAQMGQVSKTVVSDGCKLFFKLMSRDINLTNNTTSYKDFISRYSYYLNLNPEEIEKVKQVCKKVSQSQLLSSSKPQTLTAVCIYFTSNLYDFGLDRKDIAEKCETTETTLTKNYRVLIDNAEELII